eukprot:m.66180 g.66180  ORF g.66180 m.66180 type:complete len:87 (-) comp14043_c0_seq3:1577-1837(-)
MQTSSKPHIQGVKRSPIHIIWQKLDVIVWRHTMCEHVHGGSVAPVQHKEVTEAVDCQKNVLVQAQQFGARLSSSTFTAVGTIHQYA